MTAMASVDAVESSSRRSRVQLTWVVLILGLLVACLVIQLGIPTDLLPSSRLLVRCSIPSNQLLHTVCFTGLSEVTFWQAALGLARLPVFNRDEIVATNRWLESLSPEEQPMELLRWAHKTLAPGTWAQFTSFGENSLTTPSKLRIPLIVSNAYCGLCHPRAGPSGIVVTDMLRKLGLLNETKVIMIDTLHLFPETYDLMEKARDFFGLHGNGLVFRCKTADSKADFESKYGPRIWRAAPKVYDYLTKIEPTRRALDQVL